MWSLRLRDMPEDRGDDNTPAVEQTFRHDEEHPCDQLLRKHVLEAHHSEIGNLVQPIFENRNWALHIWDIYKEALGVKERLTTPIAGPSVDRRVFQYTSYVYNNHRIRSLICFACAQIKLDTGRIRSDIAFCSGAWFFALPPGSLKKCFSMQIFDERYRKSGTALAPRGNQKEQDVPSPQFDDWHLSIHPKWLKLMSQSNCASSRAIGEAQIVAVEEMTHTSILCCPEDHKCSGESCVGDGHLCPHCKVPVCRTCRVKMQENEIGPEMLINDNWISYIQDFIYQAKVTWMEKTVTSPFWTGLTLFSMGSRDKKR